MCWKVVPIAGAKVSHSATSCWFVRLPHGKVASSPFLASGGMAYEFQVGDVSGKGLKRIARQQLRRLKSLLPDTTDATSGHHEARKCVKRLRSALMLARPVIGRAKWVRLDRRLAKVARALSGARDATVLAQLLDRLEREHGPAVIGKSGRRLRAELSARPMTLETPAELAAIETRLARIKAEVKALPLREFGIADALAGLEADYRAGRHALGRAFSTGSPEAFHELRKHVQRHWRHMHLFAAAWPAEMAARTELAKSLSEVLGEEHDFWLLAERLNDAHSGLARLCHQQQEVARISAQGLLLRLFAERPKALRKRIAAYWEAASEAVDAAP